MLTDVTSEVSDQFFASLIFIHDCMWHSIEPWSIFGISATRVSTNRHQQGSLFQHDAWSYFRYKRPNLVQDSCCGIVPISSAHFDQAMGGNRLVQFSGVSKLFVKISNPYPARVLDRTNKLRLFDLHHLKL